MSWFPVDDAFHSHPKARKAGLEALGLWTVAGSHCMAYLTDGFVAEWFVKEKPRGVTLAKRLVESGLWKPGEKDGDQGWWFHDWKQECTKSHIEAARENARQRKAKSRESRVSHEAVTRDETVPSHDCLDPTQPNPTQPIKNSGYVPSEVTLGSAPTAHGTRLPDGWKPPPDVIAQMGSDYPHVNFALENAKFIDYWQGKAGKDARKADWTATWRNWIRRAAEHQQPRVVNGNHGPPIATSDLRVAQVQSLKNRPERRLEIEP